MFKRYVPAAAGILYAVPFCFRHRSHLPRATTSRRCSRSVYPMFLQRTLLRWSSSIRRAGDSQSRRERARIIRLSGAIRSQNSATGPVQVFRVGETFFEPPGSTHLIS